MNRYLWLAFAVLLAAPASASTIEVKPDPTDATFKLTTDSDGVVLTQDENSKTSFTVNLESFASDEPYDPPHEPVEGLFALKAGAPDAIPSFDITIGLRYDSLGSDEILSLAVFAKEIEGSDADASTFLASINSAPRQDSSTLLRHFWFSKEVWEARKALLDQNQREIDLFDVSIAYWYVVLAREAYEQLIVTPPLSALEAATWLENLEPRKSPDLFNDFTVDADAALDATKLLRNRANTQDYRIEKILNALDADFRDAGRAYEDVICARVRETLRIINGLSHDQRDTKKMVPLRARTLMYSAGCLATEANGILTGQGEQLESLRTRSGGLLNALRGLERSRQVTSSILTLEQALANAATRV